MRAIEIARTTFAGATIAAGLALAPLPAMAGHDHHRGCSHERASHDHGRHDHGRYDHDSHHGEHDDYDRPRHRRSRHFAIPEEIVFENVGEYRPYYERRAYYAPHRHHHVYYAFPVHTDHGVVHRRYAYCAGPSGFVAFHGPRFGFHVDF